jgi:hypothetical protein
MKGGVLPAGLFGRQRSDLLFYGEDAVNSSNGTNSSSGRSGAQDHPAAAAQQAGESRKPDGQQATPAMPAAAL